ncbi:deoR family transcriptional regulator [Plautia stali symbiont]|nr:deoR family transcriptional regulator [Plautia stali symbiont]
MVQQASRTLLLADHSKLGVISRTQYAPIGDIDLLICDGGAAKPGALSALQQALAVQVV